MTDTEHPGEPAKSLAFGYLRLSATDSPDVTDRLITALHAHAEREGLALADIYIDLLDPPVDHPDRSGFCTLMDALRRHDTCTVLIPTPEHLSRRPDSYTARRTIIEAEAGARLLVIHPAAMSTEQTGQ
jgi:DNA invertase Pin-like site-specific DNA recombinase